MGPSGAGKSTLMNILVGYVYIMQDDLIQPLLTVQESMEIAADLKLGNELNKEDKLLAVMLEMIQGEFADNVKILSNEIQNGRLCKKADPPTLEDSEIDLTRGITKLCRQETVAVMPAVFNHSLMDASDVNTNYEFPTSFLQQLGILLGRSFVQQRRNTVALLIQLFHHIFLAILVGSIFQGTGDDMSRPFANIKFCLCMVVFFLYTHIMTPVLLFPTGVKLMKREFFNRWYGLKAYYVAITIASLPKMLVFGFLFCLISYMTTSQPAEPVRFLWFYAACITTGFVSEAHGLIVGSVFSVMNGSIVAPASFSPILALAVYGMGHGDAIESYMRILMGMSYLRFGLVGITNSLYGHDRPEMSCKGDELGYCHYKDPNLYLRDLGMSDVTTLGQILIMFAYAFVYRIVAYLLLRYRLTSEFSNQVLNYAAKILRHK
ncbi:hypothetical protein C0J52_17456 [Blattella germanica]|nr:hypothetical protein C0J52_17456 [Blattella germanica]